MVTRSRTALPTQQEGKTDYEYFSRLAENAKLVNRTPNTPEAPTPLLQSAPVPPALAKLAPSTRLSSNYEMPGALRTPAETSQEDVFYLRLFNRPLPRTTTPRTTVETPTPLAASATEDLLQTAT